MGETKKLLGKKIKELRKQKHWTQEHLSELVGINPKSLLRIENGQTFPLVETLEKIADALEVQIADLFINHNLKDTEDLKKYIYNVLETSTREKIQSIYNFVYLLN